MDDGNTRMSTQQRRQEQHASSSSRRREQWTRHVFVLLLLTAVAATSTATADAAAAAATTSRRLLRNTLPHPSGTDSHSDDDASTLQTSARTLITNGEDADPAMYPFFVRSYSDNLGFTLDIVCGASLIHTDMILTAAHCQGAFNFGAVLYSPDRQSFTRLRGIDMQRVHPSYHVDKTYINYDLMVLRLEQPITDVTPVRLNSDPNIPSTSTRTDATGFGLTDYTAAVESNGSVGGVPNNLQVGYFRPLSLDECSSRGRFSNVLISEDIMCVDPWDDASICSGDSGGPLTIPADPTVDAEVFNGSSGGGTGSTTTLSSSSSSSVQAIQVGISSFGTDCQADQIPDGFVRVSYFHDWITEQICLMSRYPPSDCPNTASSSNGQDGGDEEQSDDGMVDIQLRFEHGFSSQETSFAVRNLVTNVIEMSGPEYIPSRGEIRVTTFRLNPGRYSFEVYDQAGDGLKNPDFISGQYPDGRWEMSAVYPNGARVFLGEGGPDFEKEQVTTIVVEGFSSDFTAAPSTASPTSSPVTSSPTPDSATSNPQTPNGPEDDASLVAPDPEEGDVVWSSGPFAPNDDPSSDAPTNNDIPWVYRVFVRSASSSPSSQSQYSTWTFSVIVTGLCLMLAY